MSEWQPIETAPRDETMIDVRFDPTTAERDEMGSLAEFYAPGCTRRKNPTEPVIEGVHFSNRHFRPGRPGEGYHACDMAVTLTHWRAPTTPNTNLGEQG
jgi:hypothetical protein